MNNQKVYEVKKLNICDDTQSVIRKVVAPGSKSITNRALLLAALSDRKCVLEGALFSDDSRYFAKALIELGFEVELDEEKRIAVIKGENGIVPKKQAKIYVGSAGTAARFLTAMLGFSDGEYVIEASEQMKKRPMKPLFDVLEYMGADIECLEEEGCLPIRIKGMSVPKTCDISLDISKSTQFLSAILMTARMLQKDVHIEITSDKKTGSYIEITRKVMKDFGIDSEFDGKVYTVKNISRAGGHTMVAENEFSYYIEPDVSAASYFYAAAMICGFTVQVKGVYEDVMQGDIKFVKLLEKMGGKIIPHNDGIIFEGAKNGEYNGVELNMNDFSDQALTLAAVATYAKTPTVITGISHIRGQECDRVAAIANELNKAGIFCEETEDGVKIIPGKAEPAIIETYDDHRVAMAFTLLGLKTEGIKILNPSCTRKTFENYFDEFEKLYI
ncbi:MAG: 3-phosphoshikimate 1-carboxyvinyltransferase [Lachnospiraceae bacterium]|nr:3-phosphoshikimate 1-carboxyvinyltransferase [Lachnospiraceae bacterium]